VSAETDFIKQSRKQWSSEPAFIASMAAATIGLGNLWRFPYMVGENGGGVFIVAYLISLVTVVLPIMVLEVAAGRLAQGNAVETYRLVKRVGAAYGWFVVLITVTITSYYLVITGWTLGYAVDAVRGELREFPAFSSGYNSVWYFLVVVVLAALVLARDLRAIETYAKVLMPVFFLLIIGLVYLASQTPGFEQTKVFFFDIEWGRLTEGRLWAFAFGQAFYTLAIGQGYLITYGSFIPKKTHVPRACVIVACMETSVALLAGWMIFPFVFTYGLAPDHGSQLAFVTMPRVFGDMQGGYFISVLFFGLFFAAAFSASLAGLKVVIAAVAEEFNQSNTRAVAIVAVLMVVLGTGSALSFTPVQLEIAGTPFLEAVDRIAGGNVIIFSGLLGAALFCWFIPPMTIHNVLGTTSRWWEWRIYLVGRYLPLLVLAWVMITHGMSLILDD